MPGYAGSELERLDPWLQRFAKRLLFNYDAVSTAVTLA